MRSTLFVIPHEVGGYPLFGFGLLFWLLLAAFVIWLIYVFMATKRPLAAIYSALPSWLIVALIITVLLPAVEQRTPDGTPIGLPIRGYGVMVLLGLLSGIGVTIYRGRQLGIDGERIIGLGFWAMFAGVIGARAFYVIQKWEEFRAESWMQQVVAIVKVTEGGLVVFGGVIGGLLACLIYCRLHRLPILATADLIAPGFFVGLGFGRIGCLLHGCCFGGICSGGLPAISFPPGSAPYDVQIVQGKLLGMELDHLTPPARVVAVQPGSIAEKKGILPGELVTAIRVYAVSRSGHAQNSMQPNLEVEIHLQDRTITVLPEELPERSMPVHPSQIYASINAFLLAWLVWNLQLIPRRDGITFFSALALYGISRFILEAIRSDELGQFGTSLTISQWLSLLALLVSAVAIVLLRRRSPGRCWSWPNAASPTH